MWERGLSSSDAGAEGPPERQEGREEEDDVFPVFPNVGGAHLPGKENVHNVVLFLSLKMIARGNHNPIRWAGPWADLEPADPSSHCKFCYLPAC